MSVNALLESLGFHCPAITTCVINSKLAVKGSLFFALPGEKTSGLCFLEDAKNRGAVAAIVQDSYIGSDFGLFLIRVKDPIEFLQTVAKKRMEHFSGKIVGITGSVGKTTTKEFSATLLEPLGKVWKSPGNLNSQVGLPVSLLNAEDADVFVLEMGMSVPGEIRKLVQLAPPDQVIITAVGLAHAQFFPKGVEAIAEAKAEILEGEKQPLAILTDKVAKLKAFERYPNKKVLKEHFFAEVSGEKVILRDEHNSWGPFLLPFAETHLVEDFVLAAYCALTMGVTEQALKNQIPHLKGAEKRFEKKELKGVLFINDSYNAGPVSMMAALENLPPPKKNKKTIAALGSMKELGDFSKEAHESVGKKAAEACDVIYCIGEEARPLYETAKTLGKQVEFFSDFNDLSEAVYRNAEEGDVVLIKGSNSHKMWRLLEKFH